jgi:NADPH-dependent 2,4-dienoyl-CoA reductase/sulfur reductase-like enzyme
MSLDDALELEKKLSPDVNALILGGGLIGLKCAEAIADRVKSVTVVDIARHIMPSVLDSDCAEIVKKVLQRNGVSFILGEGVTKFEGNRAITQSGNSAEFDILVIAVGVRPDTAIFEGVGNIDRGIVTDENCRTSAQDIYAAGDCALSFDIAAGENKVLALLPNAYMQGFCAGANMAGGSLKYQNAFAVNSIGFFGYHIITAGCIAGESYVNSSGDNYKRLFYADGVLKGFILGGDIQKAGIYASLIREQTPLSSVDFELLKVNPTLAALGLNKIRKCLGEQV